MKSTSRSSTSWSRWVRRPEDPHRPLEVGPSLSLIDPRGPVQRVRRSETFPFLLHSTPSTAVPTADRGLFGHLPGARHVVFERFVRERFAGEREETSGQEARRALAEPHRSCYRPLLGLRGDKLRVRGRGAYCPPCPRPGFRWGLSPQQRWRH